MNEDADNFTQQFCKIKVKKNKSKDYKTKLNRIEGPLHIQK